MVDRQLWLQLGEERKGKSSNCDDNKYQTVSSVFFLFSQLVINNPSKPRIPPPTYLVGFYQNNRDFLSVWAQPGPRGNKVLSRKIFL